LRFILNKEFCKVRLGIDKKGADFNRCGAARLNYRVLYWLWDNRALFFELDLGRY
jgi:hypothetical protein